nr:hypothetical protein [Gemmatimonadota bacterium]NIQ58012.1 hypothetical protein [Gemmatimonadota bacterium]NIU78193.1 hypothetical protein [Gammaproteobacteria bacterium]NIX47184.1 hypothetical protein [Gemmatimonadota bacterium]NIY11562.1 hypothetical protein [Gemmatimonadota bacterium]
LLILGNTLLVWFVAGRGMDPTRIEPATSLGIAILVGIMGLLLAWRFAANLRRLGREDPLERGEPTDRP